MEIANQLILSDNIKKKEKKIVKKLKSDKLLTGLYLICILENNHSQVEIIPSPLFLQTGIRDQKGFVVGIAKGHDEAIDIIEDISNRVYVENAASDIRAYFMDNILNQ